MWRSFSKRPASDPASEQPHDVVTQRLQRQTDMLAAGILLTVALIAAFTFRDYGLGWDDYTHAQYGELLLRYYTSGLSDRRALSFVNLYMYGGGFDMAAALLAKVAPFGLFETRRLVGAAVGLIGLFVTWRLGRRLGGPLAGLFALVLLATCPLYYGHMFMNPKDAPFATAMTILLFGLARALEDYPRPRSPTVILFGLGLGLSIGSRVLGGIAALFVIPPLAMLLAGQWRMDGARCAVRAFGGFLLRLIPGFVLAYAIMIVIWPWCAVAPLNPLRAVAYFSHFFEKPWKELYEGALIAVPNMPRSYVPVHFALKLPEILLILALAGIAGAAIATWRAQVPLRRRAIWILVALAATLPIIIAVATRPAMYNGIRHFIFVMPPLALMGGLAASWSLEHLGRISKAAMAAILAIMLIGLSDPIVQMVRLHPYQYTHFNRIAGGIESANERYMLDYWGLAFKEAAQQLRAKLAERHEVPPAHRHWRIAVCGPHAPADVALGTEFVTTWEPKGADFALMLGAFYCAKLEAPLLIEVDREDVIFARVYDIRGLNVTSLFTIPPVR